MDISRWQHSHEYAVDSSMAERRTRIVIGITATMMVVEIAAGIAFGSMALGWAWLDPMMGIVGSAVVSVWAYGLLRDTSGILLDRTPEHSDLPAEIRRAVESDGDSRISDLHVWQLAPGRYAAIVSIVAQTPKPAETFRDLLREHEELVHATVEVRGIDQARASASGI